jgi:hypothetical protein
MSKPKNKSALLRREAQRRGWKYVEVKMARRPAARSMRGYPVTKGERS